MFTGKGEGGSAGPELRRPSPRFAVLVFANRDEPTPRIDREERASPLR